MKHDTPKRFLESHLPAKSKFPRGTKALTKTDDGGEVPQVIGMRKTHRLSKKSDHRYHDVHTAVLRRFLMDKKGQPWDQVYSEICAEADARSYTGHQLRQYLDYLVEQNCSIREDGQVVDERGHEVARFGGHAFYVHPETRTLEHIEKRRYHRPKPVQTVFEMDGTFYHQHDGTWYRVTMELVPYVKHVNGYWHYDFYSLRYRSDAFGISVGFPYFSQNAWVQRYGKSPEGKPWYCVKKESANHREIAKLKKKHNLS